MGYVIVVMVFGAVLVCLSPEQAPQWVRAVGALVFLTAFIIATWSAAQE